MDPNQFHWQSYINFLQNYNMSHATQNSQNHHISPPPPFLPHPPPNYFMSNTQTPCIVNSQSSQTFPIIQANSHTKVSNDDVDSQFS